MGRLHKVTLLEGLKELAYRLRGERGWVFDDEESYHIICVMVVGGAGGEYAAAPDDLSLAINAADHAHVTLCHVNSLPLRQGVSFLGKWYFIVLLLYNFFWKRYI